MINSSSRSSSLGIVTVEDDERRADAGREPPLVRRHLDLAGHLPRDAEQHEPDPRHDEDRRQRRALQKVDEGIHGQAPSRAMILADGDVRVV